MALPTLVPPLAWVFWDHHQPGTWPLSDDRDDDLNRYLEPAWLEEVDLGVRSRLAQCRQLPVVGHADWEEPNLRWTDRRLHVGDSDVDDVKGAKAAGLQVAWVNRDGRARRADMPQPDFEIADLTELLALL